MERSSGEGGSFVFISEDLLCSEILSQATKIGAVYRAVRKSEVMVEARIARRTLDVNPMNITSPLHSTPPLQKPTLHLQHS